MARSSSRLNSTAPVRNGVEEIGQALNLPSVLCAEAGFQAPLIALPQRAIRPDLARE
jgi:hypothetical protein